MIKIKNIIKQLRKENKKTQEELAKAIDVSRSTIAGYETDKRKPDIDTLIKIANYFNVSVDFLLGLTSRSKRSGNNDNSSKEPILTVTKDSQIKLIQLTNDLSPETMNIILEIIKIFKKN